ncbi:MAG: hypothetical protein GYA24_02990 [Candidatus Lokiarchaeota archaeon]|nr:hypothetical protein [Candidatus Lokiarchaeota archaeon]
MEDGPAHRYLVKAWYDGQPYNGSQYQPGQPTVDGALVDALKDIGYLPRDAPHNDRFKVAGRTDKGVNALGAAFYLDLLKPLHPCEVNDRLATAGQPIMIWSVAHLDAPFNPRQAIARTYKYFHVLAREQANINTIRAGLSALAGEHDFKGFTKAGVDPALRTTRTLDVSTVDQVNDVLVFTFTSRGFLWEQVRRMVAFLLAYASDASIQERINAVFETRTQPNMAPAPPGGLILWDVHYGPEIRWENVEGCRGQFIKALRTRYIDAMARATMLDAAFSCFRGK